jgi:hypothetical protein
MFRTYEIVKEYKAFYVNLFDENKQYVFFDNQFKSLTECLRFIGEDTMGYDGDFAIENQVEE